MLEAKQKGFADRQIAHMLDCYESEVYRVRFYGNIDEIPVKIAKKKARKTASARARGKDAPLTLENSRMGITSNTTTSLDFHSERAFYEWLRKNPNLFD